jgi:hypothetical protein
VSVSRQAMWEGLCVLDRCTQAVCLSVAAGRCRGSNSTQIPLAKGVKGSRFSLQLHPNDESKASNKQLWACQQKEQQENQSGHWVSL